jgi:hypothetical protein
MLMGTNFGPKDGLRIYIGGQTCVSMLHYDETSYSKVPT